MSEYIRKIAAVATANEIAHNVAEAAMGSDEVTRAIADVSEVTQNTSDRAIQVQEATKELALLADQLQHLIEKFKI